MGLVSLRRFRGRSCISCLRSGVRLRLATRRVAVAVQNGSSSKTVDPRGKGLEWGMRRITRALKRHDERCSRYAARERVWLATKEGEQARPERQKIRFAYQRTDVLMSYLTSEKPVGRVAPLRPGKQCEDAAKS